MDADRTLSYWVNSSGTVLRIAGPWDTWLGRDGELPDRSRAENVVGKNLFTFVDGGSVEWVYQTLQARVFETGKRIEFPFRCDSRWLRRDMHMRMRLDGDALRYDSTIVSETRRERPLPQAAPGAESFISVCSFCKAYRFPNESKDWKDIEGLFTEPGLPEPFAVTHGICEPCAEACFRDL
jgi:hypothetical protein